MKHVTKLLAIFALIGSLLLCACTASPKTFTKDGMSITLTNRFSEIKQENFLTGYGSTNAAVLVTKEAFTLFEGTTLGKSSTLTDYANAVITAQKLADGTEVKTNDGVTYFNYESSVDGVTYKYMATVHKSEDAFWMIQFSAKAADYADMEADFFTYAKSITFAK